MYSFSPPLSHEHFVWMPTEQIKAWNKRGILLCHILALSSSIHLTSWLWTFWVLLFCELSGDGHSRIFKTRKYHSYFILRNFLLWLIGFDQQFKDTTFLISGLPCIEPKVVHEHHNYLSLYGACISLDTCKIYLLVVSVYIWKIQNIICSWFLRIHKPIVNIFLHTFLVSLSSFIFPLHILSVCS